MGRILVRTAHCAGRVLMDAVDSRDKTPSDCYVSEQHMMVSVLLWHRFTQATMTTYSYNYIIIGLHVWVTFQNCFKCICHNFKYQVPYITLELNERKL